MVAGGACMVAGGMHGYRGGMHDCHGGVRRIRRDMVNERAVRILLECILVVVYFLTIKKPKSEFVRIIRF